MKADPGLESTSSGCVVVVGVSWSWVCRGRGCVVVVGVSWSWGGEQQEAFDKIKSAITTDPVLQFYDVQ